MAKQIRRKYTPYQSPTRRARSSEAPGQSDSTHATNNWTQSPAQHLQRVYGNQALRRAAIKDAQPQGAGPNGGALDTDLQRAIETQRGGGQPLDKQTGDTVGNMLGTDLSGVRVHNDAKSDHLSRSINAKAFTIGNDVFFRQGGYNPGSQEGQQLLGHELTHVAQQGAGVPQVQGKMMVGPVNDRFEAEADAVASEVGNSAASEKVQRHGDQEELQRHSDEGVVQRTPVGGLIQRHDDVAPLAKAEEKAEDEVKKTRATRPMGVTPTPQESESDPEQSTQMNKTKKGATKTSPLSFETLDVTFSHKTLQKTFGKIKTGKFITGNVIVVNTRDELYAAQDKIEKKYSPGWPEGRCKQMAVDGGYDVNGFAEPPPDTGIYVFGGGPDPTATIHEMLHINAAAKFTGKVGRVVNEGITQRLAIKAAMAAKIDLSKAPAVYPQEREIVEKLVGIIGEKVIMEAYFNGADPILEAYDKVKGKGAYAQLKALLDTNDYSGGKALMDAPVPAPTDDTTVVPAKKKGGFFSRFGKKK